jgi:hypothetical protein
VAARSQAWVYGRSLAGIVGSNLAGGHGCLSVVCCQVEISRLPRKLLNETVISLFPPMAVIYNRGSLDTDGGRSCQISEGFMSLECW